jgi:hypothetical protein
MASRLLPGFHPGFSFVTKSPAVIVLKSPLHVNCAVAMAVRAAMQRGVSSMMIEKSY